MLLYGRIIASVARGAELRSSCLGTRIFCWVFMYLALAMYLNHSKRLYATTVNNGNYCLELVRKHDFDHYLCTLLLPRDVQSTVFAIRAFNVETAQIRDLVTEKATGKMRVQFWRDSINAIYKKEPPKHPVALTLATAVGRYKLSKLWFSRLLDAREANLSVNHYSSTKELEDYAENTFSSLLYLTLEAMGVRSVAADHACSHLGKAEGICTVLRAAPYHRTQRSVFIPMDIVMRHGASQERFIRADTSSQSMHNTVYDFASLCHTHLLKARSLGNKLDSMVTKALLPAVLCEDFLTRLQRADFNIFEPKLSQRNPKMPLTLLWKYFSHQY